MLKMTDVCGRVQDASLKVMVPWLESQGWLVEPITNAGDQKRLGDLRISKGNSEITIEAKADQGNYTTIFAEWLVDQRIGKPGWVQYCNASRVFYHLTIQGKIYSFEPSEIRELIISNGGLEYYQSQGLTKVQWKNESYRPQQTLGIVIEPSDLKSLKTIEPIPKIGGPRNSRSRPEVSKYRC